MPPFKWTTTPIVMVQSFEARHKDGGEAGALFVWAAWTVESLHYLADLDAAYALNGPIAGHHTDVVDVAHTRWATSAAITAIDLCAAGLGRAYCKWTGPNEFDLGDFYPQRRGEDEQQ